MMAWNRTASFLYACYLFCGLGRSWGFGIRELTTTDRRRAPTIISTFDVLNTHGSCVATRRFSSSSSSQTSESSSSSTASKVGDDEQPLEEQEEAWYEIPEDAVIQIRPNAMRRLEELRQQQNKNELHLRMGVKSGGCSGMSYVMDFCEPQDVTNDDVVDEYELVKCVVDPKSVLYLYGLELDYSSELIGGGFKFFNPNAEESCGCGSSFGI